MRTGGCTDVAFPSFEVNRNKFKFLLEKLGGDGSLCVLVPTDNGDKDLLGVNSLKECLG